MQSIWTWNNLGKRLFEKMPHGHFQRIRESETGRHPADTSQPSHSSFQAPSAWNTLFHALASAPRLLSREVCRDPPLLDQSPHYSPADWCTMARIPAWDYVCICYRASFWSPLKANSMETGTLSCCPPICMVGPQKHLMSTTEWCLGQGFVLENTLCKNDWYWYE